MNFGRSFSYIFDDPLWTNKLVMAAVLALASLIPVFGLVALSLLLGYSVELIANMKERQPNPLPNWTDIERKLGIGAPVMVALIVYNLPILFLFGCMLTGPSFIGGGDLGSTVSFLMMCCVVPFTVVYAALAWSVFALSLTRYATNRRVNTLYEVGISWAAVTANGGIVAQWVVYAFAVNIILSLLAVIPCIGWLIGAAIAVPVHAYLLGQLAILTDPARSPLRGRH